MRSLLVIGAFSSMLLASAVASARPDLNAFVNHRVTDTRSLLAEVKRDPEVADRYRRHFAMSQREVLTYLGSLRRDKLANTGEYTIYSVPNGGWVKMHKGKLKAGEPIFVDAKGRPTLIVKCGNPVVLGPNREKSRKGNPLALIPDETANTRQLAMIIPRDSEAFMPDDLLAMMPVLPVDVVAEVPPVGIPGAGEAAAMTFAPAAVPSSILGGGIPYALGLPVLLPLARGGGGGGLAPVPEPATIAALGLGVAALVRRRRKAQ